MLSRPSHSACSSTPTSVPPSLPVTASRSSIPPASLIGILADPNQTPGPMRSERKTFFVAESVTPVPVAVKSSRVPFSPASVPTPQNLAGVRC